MTVIGRDRYSENMLRDRRYKASKCPQCKARTLDEAEKLCRPTQDITGEYSCAGDESCLNPFGVHWDTTGRACELVAADARAEAKALDDWCDAEAAKMEQELPYQCDACSTPGYGPDTPCQCYPPPSPHLVGSQALLDVAAERQRQVEVEGWTPAHDDRHTDGSMAQAAAAYALKARSDESHANGVRIRPPYLWPDSWHVSWWKPKDRRRDLVRAAALIIAEIERLDRAALAATSEGSTDA